MVVALLDALVLCVCTLELEAVLCDVDDALALGVSVEDATAVALSDPLLDGESEPALLCDGMLPVAEAEVVDVRDGAELELPLPLEQKVPVVVEVEQRELEGDDVAQLDLEDAPLSEALRVGRLDDDPVCAAESVIDVDVEAQTLLEAVPLRVMPLVLVDDTVAEGDFVAVSPSVCDAVREDDAQAVMDIDGLGVALAGGESLA